MVTRSIMKKAVITLLAALFLCLSLNSCMTAMLISEMSELSERQTERRMSDISKTETELSLTVIQSYKPFYVEGDDEMPAYTINAALAVTARYDVVCLASLEYSYFDGYKVRGLYRRIGTHRYTTVKGITKTVPVFVLKSEYNKDPEYWQDFGLVPELTDIILNAGNMQEAKYRL